MIFGLLVEIRFEWCIVWWFLEKIWKLRRVCGRRRRSELQLRRLVHFRVYIHVYAMYAPACMFHWLCFHWPCHVCVWLMMCADDTLMKCIVSIDACVLPCVSQRVCMIGCVALTWSTRVWLADCAADMYKWNGVFWVSNLDRLIAFRAWSCGCD